jgi:hypothetical protein
MASETEIEETALRLLAKAGPGKTIAPMDVAVALSSNDEKEWRKLMAVIKLAAKRLASSGQIELLRHNKPVPAAELRGLYRMRLPTVE